MFKILIPAIFLMGNAFAEFNISNIKLTPTELEIVGDSLEEIKSVAIISNDSRKDFEIENVTSNQVIASPLDNKTLNEWRVLNLVISDSEKESTYPITISQKNGLITFYKLQEKETPVVKSPNKMVLDQINFVPGENNTGYDYNYSLYANPTGDFAIKGVDKDLFTIDNEGNVEISGTLKIKGKQIGFNIPYLPIKEQTIPSNSANKVVFSAGESKELVESGYTIPMNICPKGQILKSDGINFVCSLEASQEDQLGPVYTNQKSNLGIDQIYRELQINNLVIDSSGNITGALNFTSLGIMDVATGTFHVDTANGGRVGIGDGTPSVKLDITGAVDSGIRLKQGAQSTATLAGIKNGLFLEDSLSTNAVAIGYSAGNLFSIYSWNGTTANSVFTLTGTGDGVILGNLKIGAYTLPAAAGASGTVLTSGGGGTVAWGSVGGGTVNGPGTTVSGNIATWNSVNGTLLGDGGKVAANLVTNAGAGTAGFVPTFADATGKVIQNGTKLEADLITNAGAASATDNLASFASPLGKTIKDSGILSTNVMTMGTAPISSGNIMVTVAGSKTASDSLTSITNFVTMAAPATLANQVMLSSAAGRGVTVAPYTFPLTQGTVGQVLKLTTAQDAAWATVGGGDVSGPGATTALNEVAVWVDSTGTKIKGVPLVYLNIVTNVASSTVPNHVAIFDSATGKSIADSGTLISDLVTGPAGATGGNLASYNGATGKIIQDSTIIAANVVTNAGAATSNAVARFDLATGKLIKNSPVTIDDSGNLAGVGTINGKTATDFVTMTATPTSDDRVFLSTNGSKALKTTTYSLPIGPCAQDFILKTDASGNFQCVAATASGVVSFNTRQGAVVPAANDYTAAMVTNTPAGAIQASSTQGALNELDTEKLALAGGIMTGTLTTANQAAILIGKAGAVSSELRFEEGSGNQYVGFKAPNNVTTNTIWTLPPADGASGTVLSTDAAGNLSWKTSSGGDVTGPAGPVVSGNLTSFSGTTGKIIQDSGVVAANVVTGPATATPTSVAIFGASGKIIQSSAVSIDASGNMTGVGNIGSSGNLTVNGNLNVTGTGSFTGALTAQSYTNTSDRKLKKDIAPFSGGDLIDKLMPVTFRWKKGDDRPVIGLIAQDVEKVLPDVITITKTKDGSIRSYDVGQVLALTIEALKETRAEVKMLQEKIKKLEQKKR